MATVEEVRARLTADVGQFTSGFQRASATVLNFNQTATSASRRGANILRGALTGLTLEAASASGSIGRLATGIATFAGISTTSLVAILGPLAGIAIGFKRAAAEAKEFGEELERLRLRNVAHLQAIAQSESLEDLRERLRGLMEVRAQVQRQLAQPPSIGFGQEGRNRLLLKESDLTREIAAIQQQMDALHADAARTILDFVENRQVSEFEFAKVMKDEWADMVQSAQRVNELIKERGVLLKQTIGDQQREAANIATANEERAAQELRRALKKIKDLGPELNQQMNQLGQDAVRSLVSGIIEGTDNLFDLLASIFKRFLVGSILDAIFGGAGGIAKSVAAAALPGGTGKVDIPELSPAMVGAPSFNVNLPPARTPFDQARDADWQRALRESIDVAVSQGYRR